MSQKESRPTFHQYRVNIFFDPKLTYHFRNNSCFSRNILYISSFQRTIWYLRVLFILNFLVQNLHFSLILSSFLSSVLSLSLAIFAARSSPRSSTRLSNLAALATPQLVFICLQVIIEFKHVEIHLIVKRK